ncbi:MAG: hypothetical protein IIT39_15905 [Clostridia bacterium]|nr:hypothetical protein [Clostridia bacterium]
MEMTIKQLAEQLNVSKSTIGRLIIQLGFQDKMCKVGNKYILSEMQILQIKLQLSKSDEEKANIKTLQTEQKSLHDTSKTLQAEQKSLHGTSKTLQTEQKSLQTEQDKQNEILQKQLSILNKQLEIKDQQIQILQEQIGQLTAAMESMATALTAAQALHAGTIQKQLTEHSEDIEQLPNQEQVKPKQSLFSKLFGKKI